MQIYYINVNVVGNSSTCANISCINRGGTTTPRRFTIGTGRISKGKRYKSRGTRTGDPNAIFLSAQRAPLPGFNSCWVAHGGRRMAAQDCHCSAANKELHVVQRFYENRMASQNKRKFAEWEEKIK